MNSTHVKYCQDRAHLQYGLIFRSLHLQNLHTICVAILDIQEKNIYNGIKAIKSFK